MKKLLYILLSSFFLLAACATEENYKNALETWIGQTEDVLVSSWGVPESVYTKTDGQRLLQYDINGVLVLPGTEDSPVIKGAGLKCETTFIISKPPTQTVIGYSYRGGCIANKK